MKLLKYDDILKVAEHSKTPETDSNHIGLEIEFYSPYQRLQIIELVYTFKLEDMVTVKDDGSLNNDDECDSNGHEINVLMKEEDFEVTLKKVCKLLKKAEAWVDDDCGLHVHVDMRDREEKDRVFYNLVYAQPLLYALNPGHRLDNGYSDPTRKSDLEYADRDRTGINPCSLRLHNTIEIRIHEGSVTYKDISNWIKLLLSIVKCRGYKKPQSIQDCIDSYKLSSMQARYVNSKLRKRRRTKLINIDIDRETSYNTYEPEDYE
jgi:hypothetical protein